MTLIPEIWINQIQETLNENADFLPFSVDHSAYIAFGTVHMPQSGANQTVLVNPTVFPLPIIGRVDTDKIYAMNQYALEPLRIGNLDELQTSYDKKSSVIGQQMETLTQTIGDVVAVSWAASGNDNIVLTTGPASGNALAPGATGTRNQVAVIDIANLAKKMDKDNITKKGRKLLMNPDMFWELHTISDIIRASYNGFASNVLATGVIAQLFGFDILLRPTVATFTKTGTTAKAVGSATATDDRLACIAWHPTVVSRALGAMIPMFDAGSSGTGKPEFLGGLFNMEVMLGSAIMRSDQKGVASLVQTWIS